MVYHTTADQDGCTTPRCRSACGVADIIGKPEGLTMVKESFNLETNIDTLLIEKVLQLRLSAAHSVSIPPGGAQGFIPYCPRRAYCHIRPRIWRADPVGRKEMDVSSRQVSSTHAWKGRRSRRTDISSSGEVGLWVGTTRS